MGKATSAWCCQECGATAPKWLGKCPECGQFNTYIEEKIRRDDRSGSGRIISSVEARPLRDIEASESDRWLTGVAEFDRVLGGGIVPGSLVLLGGEPGVGKSTLVMQIAGSLSASGRKVLLVTGEESMDQVRIRAARLGTAGDDILILPEIDIGLIQSAVRDHAPDLVIIDSIQTLYDPDIGSAPGSVGQVRECTGQLMRIGKTGGPAIFIIGHVTKDGAIAGPRLLEHMVDAVLYFDGQKHDGLRLVRAVKNRFGSTNELAVFEMTETGLSEVANPSALFISDRREPAAGTIVAATMEGTRPLLVELQALVTPSFLTVPRRLTTGIDHSRAMMALAVLERRAGLRLSEDDIYINVVGGVRINEPALDLPLALAVAAAEKDIEIPSDVCAFGEIGLTGEVRSVGHAVDRVKEAAKLGFTRVVMPDQEAVPVPAGIELIRVRNIAQAHDFLYKRERSLS